MAKGDKKTNELEYSLQGCYGEVVTHEKLGSFLDFNFMINKEAEEANEHRFAQCIWGTAGIGKTSFCKEYRNKETTWKGEKRVWDVRDVPIAQFEEMGDLHGLPHKCTLMRGPKGEERWVPEEHAEDFKKEGWKMDTNYAPVTKMAPPDWVPVRPGPAILLLDDWNRASVRIIKGIMQLLQNFGMVSWQLPPGCNIVLTGNPDQQDFLVTSIDSAILTRIKHITLKPDNKEWAVWAERAQLDPRGINFILRYPEMMLPKGESKRSNPRTLAEFFRLSKHFPSIEGDAEALRTHANSLLDEETTTAFLVFAAKDNELTIEPEQILSGEKKASEHVKNLMGRSEPRVDILNIICERLYALIVQPTCKQTEERIKNFQNFIVMECIPEDTRDSLCRRIARRRETNAQKWLLGNKDLRKLILENLH